MDTEQLIPIAGMVTAVLINLGLFAMFILIAYYNNRSRNKERMAMIEKGMDVSEIYKRKENKYGFLKFGLIIIGIGVGLIFSVILAKINLFPAVVSYFIGVLMFTGLAILYANNLIEKRKSQEA